ncbi:P1 family peptidase [Streptomyces sp. NPDC056296]|uniref:DmpA family aminopeptidase n=1 Tax=Streptomyces sp. NPDC056296 TaxID=3345775 RepID=UPI0035D91421
MTAPTAQHTTNPPADPHHSTPSGRVRARGLGLPFTGTPGPYNALTDVPGVQVGLVTLVKGDGPLDTGHGPVRTGVTAILPRGRDGLGTSCAAGVHVLNGNGEMTGTAWINETGALATPVLLTNSHAVGACHRGAIDWLNAVRPDLRDRWHMPVVAETYDGYLNDINGDHVTPAVARRALDAADGGRLEEGSVGGGTGMSCYGFKGGTGTASRLIIHADTTYTVAVLVQANFGARHELTLAGVPVGRHLRHDDPLGAAGAPVPSGAGSVIVTVATDAPLLPGQCAALARRVPLGLARSGTTGSHFSGDLFLAFSTANPSALASHYPAGHRAERLDSLLFVPWGDMDRLFDATVHCVEEAVADALVANTPMTGRDGHHLPALPHQQVIDLLRDHHAFD